MKLTNLIALYEDEEGERVAVLYGNKNAAECFDNVVAKVADGQTSIHFTEEKPMRVIKQLAFNEFWLKQEAELERILNGSEEQEKA